MSTSRLRPLLLLCLWLVPFAVYWQTVTYEYGFRDDYAHLREVREEPDKLFKLTSSHGRPIYGAVLEASLEFVRGVPDLPWLRATSVLLLTAVGALLFARLRRSGWSELEAGAIGLGVVLLPGAQITIGWAIAWPIALGLLFAVAGFGIIESQVRRTGARRAAAFAVGGALYFLAGLTYQTSALFAVVPLAAVLLLRGDREPLGDVRFVVAHLGTLFLSLVGGFLLMQLVFTEGVVPEAARMQLEPDPLLKLWWFIRQPLVNSIALFELRDRFATIVSFWIAAAAFFSIIVTGFALGTPTRRQRLRWLFCAVCLPFVAHAVSLAASSQAIGYRTVFPLAGLMLVLVVYGLRSMLHAERVRPAVQRAAFAMLAVVAVVMAQRNSVTLIAEPQGREWELIQSAVNALELEPDTDIYIIRPTIVDRSTERVFDDEFGSLSSDADWASKEMFKAAMRERFPQRTPSSTDVTVTTGFAPPPLPAAYDLVIDLRKLKNSDEAPLTVATEASASPR